MPPFSAAEPARRVAVLSLLALALLALLIWAAQRARPVGLSAAEVAKLPCVSYAPFRRAGHTPFDAALVVAPELIEADLRLLSTLSGCVRTYGVDHGLDAVPAIARRLGLRVVLGVWIGRDSAANAAQLQRALALSREHADVVDLLMVGNEVLLRRELSPQALAALLADARRRTKVPVSYADVWEFWLRHGDALREHVDVISVHVLPYWEDHPVAVRSAVEHVRSIAARTRAAFAPLPVFVAETGWPAFGRQRGPARPGVVEQARFVREMQASAAPAAGGLPAFNVIEAFDQPWKRALEGAMGGYWGLFDAQGTQRVTLAGAVVEDAQAGRVQWAAGAGAVCAALVALPGLSRRRGAARHRPAAPMLAGVLAAALAGAMIAALALLQWQQLLLWNRSALEWAVNGAMAAVALACSAAATAQLSLRIAQPLHAAGWQRAAVVDVLRRSPHAGVVAKLLAVLNVALLFAVAWAALLLVFDGRYRPLIVPLFAAPALLLMALALLGVRLPREAREERLLAAMGAVAAPMLLFNEGLANAQACGAAAIWCALALATWWRHRQGPAEGAGRTHTSAASSTAGAAMSAQ